MTKSTLTRSFGVLAVLVAVGSITVYALNRHQSPENRTPDQADPQSVMGSIADPDTEPGAEVESALSGIESGATETRAVVAKLPKFTKFTPVDMTQYAKLTVPPKRPRLETFTIGALETPAMTRIKTGGSDVQEPSDPKAQDTSGQTPVRPVSAEAVSRQTGIATEDFDRAFAE